MFWFFFFFKQKTAYELRISDWSSDVCSSDLSDRINSCVRCGKTAPEPARALCSDSWYRTTWSFHMRRQESRWARVPAPCETAYQAPRPRQRDRKSVVEGKSVSVRVDPGGRRIIKKKKKNSITHY